MNESLIKKEGEVVKKCILIPDSFKGSLSALEFCEIVSEVIIQHYPNCEIHQVPVADGGEGTVDCFVTALHAEIISVQTVGPYQEPIVASYAKNGTRAIIELAQCAGLPLAEHNPNPAKTTTYGVGMMIRHAVEHGCREIVVGLGGSATNDGGCGLAHALGVNFYDAQGNSFLPYGETLSCIHQIDTSACRELLSGCTITAMCDIDNPLYGKQGAAAIFAPQKGADKAMVKQLDAGLISYAKAIQSSLGVDVAHLSGAGAAGGVGAGIVAFLGGTLTSGIQTVLNLIDFDKLVQGADLVITGEGKLDFQSMRGKVVIGVAERAKQFSVPVLALVGAVGEGAQEAYEHGVSAIFSVTQDAIPFSEARYRSREFLKAETENLCRLSKIFSKES